MSQSETSGPKIGQTVIYSPSAGVTYPAMLIAVAAGTGLVRLTVFQPGATFLDAQNVPYDYTRNIVFPSWSYPGPQSGI
jgi:hypothetical protein